MKSSEQEKTPDKKKNKLVVQTKHEHAFDTRWAEIKISGKNISSRSNHAAVFFNNVLYIHGGYDADKGVLPDFQSIDLNETSECFQWHKLNNKIGEKPIQLKNHSAVAHKTSMVIFGGQLHTNESSNSVYVYNFVQGDWKEPKVSGVEVPKVDSHSVAAVGDKMYIYGGYIPETAKYLSNIYCLDLEKYEWELIYEAKGSGQEPEPRSNFSMVSESDCLYIFGGSNGEHTMDDFWKFSLNKRSWEKIKSENPPEARRGHSMVTFDGNIFLFGGIQDITKERNDIYIYEINKNNWNKIHSSTNSIYDCSPTLKQERQSPTKSPPKSPEKLQLHKITSEKPSEKSGDVMKKIINEGKQKRFLEKKKELLDQFNVKTDEKSRKRTHSPTTESMLKTLESIGNQEMGRNKLHQEIVYDESHRYIIGKKPSARDGQSTCVNQGKMYIFGGDRHLMAFNDLFEFDLEKGVKSLDLYRS